MSSFHEIANSVDVFALDCIDGENVIITMPTIIGARNTEWEGSLIFRKKYLSELITYSLEHNILTEDDVQRALKQGCPHPKA